MTSLPSPTSPTATSPTESKDLDKDFKGFADINHSFEKAGRVVDEPLLTRCCDCRLRKKWHAASTRPNGEFPFNSCFAESECNLYRLQRRQIPAQCRQD